MALKKEQILQQLKNMTVISKETTEGIEDTGNYSQARWIQYMHGPCY